MTRPDAEHVIIAGAGLGGALLACFLGQRGFRVDVYERRSDPRAQGFIGGRSINLALSTRGLDALERVGLARAVLGDGIPMRGRMMHSVDGDLVYQPYSKNPSDAIHSVARGGLNLTLLEAADACESVTLHFGFRCTGLDLDRRTATFRHEESGETIETPPALVVGADGAYSAVRSRLQRNERFDYSQTYLEHGYKELTIPPSADDRFAMERNALHIWPRGGYMMIALPNQDRTFTCTCFWPYTGPNGFDDLGSEERIVERFRSRFGDAVPLMPTLVEDYQRNPIGSLVTVRCNPWHHRDAVVLIGDAAHAIVPFYGQGMNCAFEDCRVLDECIERLGPDWARVLPEYTKARKANGDAIADLALRNFIEMRDKVGSRFFLLGKKVEKLLHRWFPRWFTPLYNMVTFSTIPYAQAQARARAQSRVVIGTVAITVVVLVSLVALLLWGVV